MLSSGKLQVYAFNTQARKARAGAETTAIRSLSSKCGLNHIQIPRRITRRMQPSRSASDERDQDDVRDQLLSCKDAIMKESGGVGLLG